MRDERDIIFVSHANPEDNDIALWLTTHLTREGYHAWCDLPELLGGEKFWSEIEETIRHKSAKVLYVLSKTSNLDCDRGFRKELHLADSEAKRHAANGRRDFLIPLAVDDLNPSDYNIYVQQRNSIRFQDGWASGFPRLLKKLRRDDVPRQSPKKGSSALSEWWRQYRSATAGVERKPTNFLSNWFPINGVPEQVFLHKLESTDGRRIGRVESGMPHAVAQQGDFLLSFASAGELSGGLPPELSITATEPLPAAELSNGVAKSENLDSRTLKSQYISLLRQAWERWVATRAVGIYELSSERKCAYFLKPDDRDAKGYFRAADGRRTWKGLTGVSTRKSKMEPGVVRTRHWHFGLHANPKLYPVPVYYITSHVVFSTDGKDLWTDKGKMHRARRNQCKTWYNEAWRDRLLAAIGNVSEEQPQILLPVSPDKQVVVGTSPVTFGSKISFRVLVEKIKPKAIVAVANALGTDVSAAELAAEVRDSAVDLEPDGEEEIGDEEEIDDDLEDEPEEPKEGQ